MVHHTVHSMVVCSSINGLHIHAPHNIQLNQCSVLQRTLFNETRRPLYHGCSVAMKWNYGGYPIESGEKQLFNFSQQSHGFQDGHLGSRGPCS